MVVHEVWFRIDLFGGHDPSDNAKIFGVQSGSE